MQELNLSASYFPDHGAGMMLAMVTLLMLTVMMFLM
jgi:hypothetical protein